MGIFAVLVDRGTTESTSPPTSTAYVRPYDVGDC